MPPAFALSQDQTLRFIHRVSTTSEQKKQSKPSHLAKTNQQKQSNIQHLKDLPKRKSRQQHQNAANISFRFTHDALVNEQNKPKQIANPAITRRDSQTIRLIIPSASASGGAYLSSGRTNVNP